MLGGILRVLEGLSGSGSGFWGLGGVVVASWVRGIMRYLHNSFGLGRVYEDLMVR